MRPATATVAVIVLAPSWTVQPPTVATPFASVTAVAPVTLPPPVTTWNDTAAFAIGALAASRTRTAGATLSENPVRPVCPLPAATTTVPPVMVKAALVAWGSAPEAATSVYPVPALSIRKSANVTMPATAERVSVPESVPPPGFAPIAIVTPAVNAVAVFPKGSRAVTATPPAPVLMIAAAAVVVGWLVNSSTAAAAGVTITTGCCVTPTPPTVADTVFDSATVALREPVAVPFPSVEPVGWVSVLPVPVDVRTTLAPAMRFPNASFAVTVMVDLVPPLLALMDPGDAATVDWDADTAPAATVNGALEAPASCVAVAVRT